MAEDEKKSPELKPSVSWEEMGRRMMEGWEREHERDLNMPRLYKNIGDKPGQGGIQEIPVAAPGD